MYPEENSFGSVLFQAANEVCVRACVRACLFVYVHACECLCACVGKCGVLIKCVFNSMSVCPAG